MGKLETPHSVLSIPHYLHRVSHLKFQKQFLHYPGIGLNELLLFDDRNSGEKLARI
jgi:hypothetical protein